MGLIHSRRTTGADEAEIATGNPYRYPPKSGNYFGNYFIMGGERFETNQQDTYLFGDNDDLNFLGSKPTPFPYPAPQPHEPTRTLKSLVNIRRDSLRFIKEVDESIQPKVDGEIVQQPATTRYNIEFTFDSDVKCAITIYYFATEEVNNKHAVYHPRDARMNSETFHYKRGANQTFIQSLHVIDPTQFPEEDWQYSVDRETIPIVIHCVVEEEDLYTHSHVTYAVVDKTSDGSYSLKCLKQKQFVDGVGYLLQEVYGIENKNTEKDKTDDDVDDNGSECVICMCEMRDTLILPCRHLCLCNGCADNLRYQASNCPICRVKFCALLQIRAMRRKTPAPTGCGAMSPAGAVASVSTRQTDSADELPLSQEGVPPGYEAVSLIEALNGPTQPHCAVQASIGPADGTLRSLPSSDSPLPKDETSGCVAASPVSDAATSQLPSVTNVNEATQPVRSSSTDVRADINQPCHRPAKKQVFTPIPLSDGEEASSSTVDAGGDTVSPTSTRSEAGISSSYPQCSLAASVHSSVEIISELSTDSHDSTTDNNCKQRLDAPTKQRLSDPGTSCELPSCVDTTLRSATTVSDSAAADVTGTTSLLDVHRSVEAHNTNRSSGSSDSSNKELLSGIGSMDTVDAEAL